MYGNKIGKLIGLIPVNKNPVWDPKTFEFITIGFSKFQKLFKRPILLHFIAPDVKPTMHIASP